MVHNAIADARPNSAAILPGPRGLPVLGSLPEMGRDILGFFTDTARQYGDIAAFRLAGWPAVLLSHPDLAEVVLVKNHQNFIKHSLPFHLVSEAHLRCQRDLFSQPSGASPVVVMCSRKSGNIKPRCPNS